MWGRLQKKHIHKLLLAEMDAVYRLAYHLCARGTEADDLVQETYLRAFKGADKFQLTESGPRPWLFKILHNVIFSKHAAQLRETAVLNEKWQGDSTQVSDATTACHTDLANLQWDAIDERLKQALQSLAVPARTTFLLCAVEGMKYREIADVTGVPVGTVMSRLYRARADITAHLGEYAREQGWSNECFVRPAPLSPPASSSVLADSQKDEVAGDGR